MFIKNWKKEILTIPNLLSFFRLILIPVYMTVYLNAREVIQFQLAGMILAVSCLTDAIDGWIARHFNMITNLGKILDPLADKATQFALTLCLSLKYPVLNPVLALFVAKELFQLILFIVYLHRGQALSGALPAGKICTCMLFVSLIFLMFFPTLHPGIVAAIALLDAVFLLISFGSYVQAYWGKDPKVRDLNPP